MPNSLARLDPQEGTTTREGYYRRQADEPAPEHATTALQSRLDAFSSRLASVGRSGSPATRHALEPVLEEWQLLRRDLKRALAEAHR